VWSPDGTRIAFVGARSGIANIHVVNADGSGGRQVTHLGGWNEQPTWSSDGSHIAFANFDGVYVAKADGSGGAQLLIPFGDWPAWSPDGSRIAYGAAGGGIAVSKADGTGAVRLTDDGLDWMPAWSSDGERIAFARGYNDVYVMNADGSALLDVTQHQFHDYYPAWGRAR
jgi:Tol biopolymer transport system component